MRAGSGKSKRVGASSITVSIAGSRASALMRDCAWRALVALSRKRSTKVWMCARSAATRSAARACCGGAFGADAHELVEAAGGQGNLAAIEMRDRLHRAVQQAAVVRDDQRRAGEARQPALQPQRRFEVEVVGRLVQQQQVGVGEQRRGQRHAHPPAAGEFRHRPRLRRRRRSPSPARMAPRAPARQSASIARSRSWMSASRSGAARRRPRRAAPGARDRPRARYRAG